jgi:hypothetical protein
MDSPKSFQFYPCHCSVDATIGELAVEMLYGVAKLKTDNKF